MAKLALSRGMPGERNGGTVEVIGDMERVGFSRGDNAVEVGTKFTELKSINVTN